MLYHVHIFPIDRESNKKVGGHLLFVDDSCHFCCYAFSRVPALPPFLMVEPSYRLWFLWSFSLLCLSEASVLCTTNNCLSQSPAVNYLLLHTLSPFRAISPHFFSQISDPSLRNFYEGPHHLSRDIFPFFFLHIIYIPDSFINSHGLCCALSY